MIKWGCVFGGKGNSALSYKNRAISSIFRFESLPRVHSLGSSSEAKY